MQSFKILMIISWIFVFTRCGVSKSTNEYQTGTLDTINFVLSVDDQLRNKLGINDSIELYFEGIFYNNLEIILEYYSDDLEVIDPNYSRNLTMSRPYYFQKYAGVEKISFPRNSNLNLVKRSDFMMIESDFPEEMIFAIFNMPYYLSDGKWFVLLGYYDRYSHGYSYGLIVEHSKHRTQILHVFDAGAS